MWSHAKQFFENASYDPCTKRLFGALRPLYRPRSIGASSVRDKHGNLTQSMGETKQAIAEHFSESLEARPCSMSSLILKDRAANIEENRNLSIDSIDWSTCPSFSEVAHTFPHLKPVVGVGEDGLGSELFKACPARMASIFHPLFFKSAIAMAPPMQLKGGHLLELFKGKGSKCNLSSFRDVTICNSAAKPLCMHLRSQSMKPLARYSCETQFGGGLNGGSTDFPRLYLDASRSIAHKNKLSFACVYIDLKSAFASIVRGFALEPLGASMMLISVILSRELQISHSGRTPAVQDICPPYLLAFTVVPGLLSRLSLAATNLSAEHWLGPRSEM